jgi:hypothetical protein
LLKRRVCLQLAQFLCANTCAPAATFCAALRPPAAGQPNIVQCKAVALLAAQHDEGLIEAVVAAHPVLDDPRRPLLPHKLAALPPVLHEAMCRRYVRASGGVADVSVQDSPTLLAALQALRGVRELSKLTVGRDYNVRLHDPQRLLSVEASMEAAQLHIVALTRLTNVELYGMGTRAACAAVSAVAALPALASLKLGALRLHDTGRPGSDGAALTQHRYGRRSPSAEEPQRDGVAPPAPAPTAGFAKPSRRARRSRGWSFAMSMTSMACLMACHRACHTCRASRR